MQLPRGTFQYIKKGNTLGGILEELHLMKFSGICTISFGSINGSLVFKSGKHILAEFRNIGADAAWDEFQKIAGERVDASVSTLDDTQIELSLEFNKSCRIGKGVKQESSPLSPPKTDRMSQVKTSPPVSPGEIVTVPVKNPQKPHIPEMSALHPAITFETIRAQEPSKILQHKSPSPVRNNNSVTATQHVPDFSPASEEKKRCEDETSHPADTDSKSFESDIATIETMNVDIMTSKIRGECKTLIKQLRLEHLTDR